MGPHLWSVALCAARLLPIFFLCPMLGGRLAPSSVRLSLTLAFALCIHLVGGVSVPGELTVWELGGMAVRELLFGLALGLIASLPFDAARMGGRFIDLFRGTSAEAALPMVGTHEAATSNLLYQLVLTTALVAGVLPVVVSALFHSFALVGLGGASLTEEAGMGVVRMLGGAFALGLAIGAPVAGVTMACDGLVGLIAKVAPQMNLPEVATPLKILAGGAVVWLSLGLVCERLIGVSLQLGDSLGAFAQLVR
jgi:flagellar biosynthetic protein FliR/type III secretion protein T